jgi:predicted aldo/keto reductase-like oxidoreductase
MIYKKLGRTNLNVSVIGLGGGVFNRNKDPSITLEKAREAINFAVNKGINFIDMGKEYDEEFISDAIKEVREKIHVITRSESRNAEEMEKDIKDSIKKLKVKPVVYEIMVNSVEDLRNKEKEGVIAALKEAKLKGEIKFTGIFSHKIEVLKEAIKTNEFDVVMTLYNAVHRMAEQIFPLKKKYKFGFIAAAPFATGIIGKNNKSAEEALKFVLSSNYVDTVVIGMKNLSHVNENVSVGSKEWKISKTERNKILEKFENFLGKNFCRMCRYCQCPIGIQIADILKLRILAISYNHFDLAKFQYSMQKIKADLCNECGICEKECPYNLRIIELLKDTHKILAAK